MWFKNIKLFRLISSFKTSADQLNDALCKERFVSGGAMVAESHGWVPPVEGDARLVYSVGKQILCVYRVERKLLPASVIKEFVKIRAQEIHDQQGFKPGRKQIKDLKDQVTNELIPRAFSIHTDIRIWIDPVHHWLAIDTSSTSKSEHILSALAKVIYPFPVEPVHVTTSPEAAMTQWILTGEAPEHFTIDRDADLRDSGEKGAVVRYVKHRLDHDEIATHTKSGKRCTRLALTWNDRVSFVLTNGLEIKRVTPLDVLTEHAHAKATDHLEKFESDFTLMTAELHELFTVLMHTLSEVAEQPPQRVAA